MAAPCGCSLFWRSQFEESYGQAHGYSELLQVANDVCDIGAALGAHDTSILPLLELALLDAMVDYLDGFLAHHSLFLSTGQLLLELSDPLLRLLIHASEVGYPIHPVIPGDIGLLAPTL